MRVRVLLSVLSVLFIPVLAARASAQTAATISGTVEDPNRGALAGVTVTVRNVDTSLTRSVATGHEGRYVIAGLPPGEYELRAELASFKPHVRRGLQLTVGQALVLNVMLEVGGLSEEVTVTGNTPLVNSSSAELSYLVGADAIDALPLNGRNYTDLALLQPGVLAYPHRDGGSVVAHGLGMSVNGQDPRSNVYLLDGTLQNDFTNGPAGSAAGTALGTETVREFRVESNAYGAEFGRNSGGQINVLTKSGANSVDGSAFEYHRNEALRRPQLLRHGRAAGLPPQPVRRHGRRTDCPRPDLFLPGLRSADRAAWQNGQHGGAGRQRPAGDPAGRHGHGQSGCRPLFERVPPSQRPLARAGARRLHVPLQSDRRRALRAGPRGSQLRRRQPAVRALHLRRHRSVPADRLSAVSEELHLAQPVLHRRVPADPVGEHDQHHARRIQPHPHRPERPGQHVDAAAGLHRDPRQHGGHRHRRPPPLRSAELGQPAPHPERLQRAERSRAHARPPCAQVGRTGRALPGQHGEPDVQPRDLQLRRPERLPDQPARQLRRAYAGGAVRSLLALHAVRLLRAGRHPAHAAAHVERRPAL